MENAEEILQCLDEFSKLRPKEIPPELEYYLSFVARTGDPVYQWPIIKCLFREKLVNVITEFYEACPSVEIPPCPNVEIFNYEAMKGFILEKLDTFAAAPFTVQRICELLTSPRKEYNRIDKYMRALEKNILVVSTREPGNRKSTENGESVVNGLESEHGSQEMVNSLNSDINVEVDMDEKTVWHKSYGTSEPNIILESHTDTSSSEVQESYISDSKTPSAPAPTPAASASPTSPMTSTPASTTVAESVITTRQINYIGYTNEMLVEPSTISEAQPDNSDAPTVFSLARQTDKEEEHIYVTEDSAFVKADCSEMDTNQIIAEPITPPEPEETPHPEKSTFVEAVVESSSQATATAVTTTSGEGELEEEADKAVGSSSNEAAITSTHSSEMPQSSTDQPAETNPEITASDHQEVTESNIVIGPEDMQVEDISPEPEVEAEVETEAEAEVETEAEAKVETKADAETKAEAETKTEESTSVCPEIVIPPAEAPKSPENLLEVAKEKQPEEVPLEIENTKTEESPRGEEAPQIQIQIQNQKEEVEAPQEIVKVTESN